LATRLLYVEYKIQYLMLKYRVSPKTNSLNKKEPVYTAMLVSDETTTEDWFYNEMTRRTRFRESDCMRILFEIRDIIEEGLRNNNIVHVPHLGNFRVTARSTTVSNPKDFKPNHIKELKLQFNPDKRLKQSIKSFPLKKM